MLVVGIVDVPTHAAGLLLVVGHLLGDLGCSSSLLVVHLLRKGMAPIVDANPPRV